MGFFSKFFGKKVKTEFSHLPEYMQSVMFNNEFSDMMKSDRFIARSDYRDLIQKYESTATFFENNQRAKTLTYYCKVYVP